MSIRNSFASDLHRKVMGEDEVFFSPYSIETALSMVAVGAKGDTRLEMCKVLGLPQELESQIQEARNLYEIINGGDEERQYVMHTGNAIWPADRYRLQENYINCVRDNFGGGLQRLDYINDSPGAAKIINEWVSEQTHEKIPTIVSADDLGRFTSMVLTNAIYFKGDWSEEFKEIDTKKENFYVSNEESVKRDLMHRSGSYHYAEDDEVQVLDMPYKGEELSMLVVLPKEIEGLSAVESSWTSEKYDGWCQQLKYIETVALSFPKFKLETEIRLSKILKEMGMLKVFDDFANLSGIYEKDEKLMKISEVIHKAFVEVNEKGTEAAAATVVTMICASALVSPSPPTVFCADRPFMFFIRHRATNKILFVGKYTG